MCNLYSITTNQAAIIALFRVINRYVGNLPPMTGVFPEYPAPIVRNVGAEHELTMMRWGMPPPPRTGGFACQRYHSLRFRADQQIQRIGLEVR
jgi:putative SOS response-associated peptidase YedK